MQHDFSQYSPEDLERLANEMREKAAGEPVSVEQTVEPSRPSSSQDRYAATEAAWLSSEYDFTTPGGRTCRLRALPVEELAASGDLEKLTRLPGVTQELINRSEGKPPAPAITGMPDKATMVTLVDTLNILLPMVVVRPVVHSTPKDPKDKVVGQIYVDSIPLPDRIAILNEVVGAVQKWDNFRG